MRILRHYILKEFMSAFFLSVFVLTFVMLLGSLVRLAELLINKGVPLSTAGMLLLYQMPFLFTYILPLSTMAGTLLAVGRLSSDNEIIAIRASGINLLQIFMPLLSAGMIISLFCVILNNQIVPDSHHKSRQALMEVGAQNPAAALEAGKFITAFDKFILFIFHIEGNKFSNIRIYEPQGAGKPPRTIIARHGEFLVLPEKQILKLKLVDGTSDEINPSDPDNFYKLNFKTYFMNIDFKKGRDRKVDKKTKDMTLSELKQQEDEFSKNGITTNPIIAEIHQRLALAFSCFIFVFIGAPMAMITRRRERPMNYFGMALVIMGLYYVSLIGFQALSIEGSMPAQFMMWIPNILLGITGLILFYKKCLS